MGTERTWVPVTPGGTICLWLESSTEEEAWEKLLEDAAHMPYAGREGFEQRGYTVEPMGRRPVPNKIECPKCGKRVKKAGLKMHMSDVHGDENV